MSPPLVLLWLLLWLPALRPLFKYAPLPGLLAGLWGAALLAGLWAWRTYGRGHPRLMPLLNRWLSSYLLIGGMTLAVGGIYPIADARKLLGKGSTADDAMIEPARALLATGQLYDVSLYDGAPISPGPGWILLHAPLVWLGLYWLITPLHLLLLLGVLRQGLGAPPAPMTAFVGLLGSSLLTWDLLVTGHDLIALSLALLSLTLLAHRTATEATLARRWLLPLALLMGVVATARVVFLCHPLLMGAFLWRSGQRRPALWLTGLALAVALGLHAWGYLSHDLYQPLHLFGRGERNVGTWLIGLGGIATLAVGGWVWWSLRPTRDHWLRGLSYCLLVPLATIALGEWLAVGGDFARWEGANYLLPPLVALLGWEAVGDRSLAE